MSTYTSGFTVTAAMPGQIAPVRVDTTKHAKYALATASEMLDQGALSVTITAEQATVADAGETVTDRARTLGQTEAPLGVRPHVSLRDYRGLGQTEAPLGTLNGMHERDAVDGGARSAVERAYAGGKTETVETHEHTPMLCYGTGNPTWPSHVACQSCGAMLYTFDNLAVETAYASPVEELQGDALAAVGRLRMAQGSLMHVIGYCQGTLDAIAEGMDGPENGRDWRKMRANAAREYIVGRMNAWREVFGRDG